MSNQHIGVKNGKLGECPSSPNCVSTQTSDQDKQMEPLPFDGGLMETKQKVKEILSDMERTTIEDDSEHYMHAVVKSKIMRFKDDVEFYFDEDQQVVHFRSASRVGYSDFGVNRKRMEDIAAKYKNKEVEGVGQ
ncbi:DUF1499 domain-containing protein [Halobacillus salinus]|uniref:DUF1499 domain-containing protein n=1 Tax=Halobacillus salinus TaxID=192814 RepID=A0A4Z0H4L9_9BACI|nr:DUF1499 domain-containing protein [Halobacillus salinus]TGB05363.1 DUF1499 domain-containing protein [Halobacillus salinus]